MRHPGWSGRSVACLALFGVALALLACTQPGKAGEPDGKGGAGEVEAQRQAITGFYEKMISFQSGGLPTPQQLEQLSPLISKNLKTLLLGAMAGEEKYQKGLKEPSPPLVEGAFYCSLFEGVSRLGEIVAESGAAGSFLVSLEWGDSTDPKQSAKWQDRVFLVKEEGRWVVDDLELLGQWDFGPKGKLSYRLKFVAKQMED